MIELNMNPTFLHLGQFEIRYYGLFYVMGFIVAYFMLKYLFNKKIQNQRIEDLLVYAGIFGILGARLFYILVYNLPFYLQNPIEMLMIQHGGLSFHGGLIGAMIGIYLFARKNNLKLMDILDKIVIPFSFALGLGRIGNFINQELYGRVTDVSWCFNFGDGLCRHPSQLYESFYSFVIFGILFSLRNKKMKRGVLFAWFLVLYSALRFITEFFREPDSQLGFIMGITMGQILCILMFVAGLFMLFKFNKFIKKNKRKK
ncbi:prolipoprotein diacylglyceryl transferase [Candidatus Woesearchaeota archaeon]|nr:prolipoprotein diacylglyceryl transferase [Candidatus Woesearchaeota archaeon]